jgi:hypothetical protein
MQWYSVGGDDDAAWGAVSVPAVLEQAEVLPGLPAALY